MATEACKSFDDDKNFSTSCNKTTSDPVGMLEHCNPGKRAERVVTFWADKSNITRQILGQS